jgi:hypothetical protein
MDEKDLLTCIQARAARMAVGASAVRGQGEGVALAARGFFEVLPLASFGSEQGLTAPVFDARVDGVTENLRLAFPAGAQFWGLARKLLNIFLRDSTYTFHLRVAYGLDAAEPLLELPLDSITAAALHKCSGTPLPRWLGVKGLTPAASAQYQRAAQERAQAMGISRVHLDACWWAHERSSRAAQQ